MKILFITMFRKCEMGEGGKKRGKEEGRSRGREGEREEERESRKGKARDRGREVEDHSFAAISAIIWSTPSTYTGVTCNQTF